MTRRWYHVSGAGMCFGFAINQHFVVVDCGKDGFEKLYGKCVKEPEIRKWFIDNNLSVIEVTANKKETPNEI
jgi:hypothetical protein